MSLGSTNESRGLPAGWWTLYDTDVGTGMNALKIVFWSRLGYSISITVPSQSGTQTRNYLSRNDVSWDVALGRPVLKPLNAHQWESYLFGVNMNFSHALVTFKGVFQNSNEHRYPSHFYKRAPPRAPSPNPVRDLKAHFISWRLC